MRDLLTFALSGRSWRTLAAAQTDAAEWIADGLAGGDPLRRTGFCVATAAGSLTCLLRLDPRAADAFDPRPPVHPCDRNAPGKPATSSSIDPRALLPYPAAPLGFGSGTTSPADVAAELFLLDAVVRLQALWSDAAARLAATAGNRARNGEQVLPLDGADCTAVAGSSASLSDLTAGAVVCPSGSFR